MRCGTGLINYKKILLSDTMRILGLEKLLFAYDRLRYGTQYIRVVNYHSSPADSIDTFESHLQFYKEHFSSVSLDDLKCFFEKNGKWVKSKPGLIISFDDGIYNNYSIRGVLEKYGFVGWFFVSPGFSDTPINQQVQFAIDNRIADAAPLENGRMAMTWDELKELTNNHVIGCHTNTHCRLYKHLSHEQMFIEIVDSKKLLEEKLGKMIEIFCWVGGELDTYNQEAMRLIKKGGLSVCIYNDTHADDIQNK